MEHKHEWIKVSYDQPEITGVYWVCKCQTWCSEDPAYLDVIRETNAEEDIEELLELLGGFYMPHTLYDDRDDSYTTLCPCDVCKWLVKTQEKYT